MLGVTVTSLGMSSVAHGTAEACVQPRDASVGGNHLVSTLPPKPCRAKSSDEMGVSTSKTFLLLPADAGKCSRSGPQKTGSFVFVGFSFANSIAVFSQINFELVLQIQFE